MSKSFSVIFRDLITSGFTNCKAAEVFELTQIETSKAYRSDIAQSSQVVKALDIQVVTRYAGALVPARLEPPILIYAPFRRLQIVHPAYVLGVLQLYALF